MKLIDEGELASLIRDSIKLSYLETRGINLSLEDYYEEVDDEELIKYYKDYEAD